MAEAPSWGIRGLPLIQSKFGYLHGGYNSTMKVPCTSFLLSIFVCAGCGKSHLPCKNDEAVYLEAQRIVSEQLKFPAGATYDEKPTYRLDGDTLNVMFTVRAVNAFNVPTEHFTFMDFICEEGRAVCIGGLGPGGRFFGNDKGAYDREKADEERRQLFLDSARVADSLHFDSLIHPARKRH